MSDSTNIRISTSTWRDLRDMKGPGDSFDDVLTELLDETEPIEN